MCDGMAATTESIQKGAAPAGTKAALIGREGFELGTRLIWFYVWHVVVRGRFGDRSHTIERPALCGHPRRPLGFGTRPPTVSSPICRSLLEGAFFLFTGRWRQRLVDLQWCLCLCLCLRLRGSWRLCWSAHPSDADDRWLAISKRPESHILGIAGRGKSRKLGRELAGRRGRGDEGRLEKRRLLLSICLLTMLLTCCCGCCCGGGGGGGRAKVGILVGTVGIHDP